MSTIWRPNLGRLRASVAEMEGSESAEEEKDATKKGVKRKRAPYTKGPCEHGVKPRSRCKVCSACPHGKRRLSARSAAGAQSAHGRERSKCKECGGSQICVHGRRVRKGSAALSAHSARSAVGVSNLRARPSAALSARSAADLSLKRVRSQCKECGRQRVRSQCKECGGGIPSTAVSALSARSAVGSQICEHGRQRLSLQGVRRVSNLRTAVGALSARSAAGAQSASTPAGALGARSARWWRGKIARLNRDSNNAADADPREARRHDVDTS